MPANRFVFVVRLWSEDSRSAERPFTLRGSVQMIDDDKVLYFHSLEQLSELVRQLAGWPEDPPKTDRS